MEPAELRKAVREAEAVVMDMKGGELLSHFVELVQWHTRNEYSGHGRDVDQKHAEFIAAEKELLRRLGTVQYIECEME